MSVLVLVDATVKSPDDFDAYMREILPATRVFEGCEGLTVQRNLDDAKNVVLIEQWESRAHYDKYLAWRDGNGTLAKIVALLEGPPSIRYYSIVGA